MAVTIRDVAKKAKTSIATVSRVLNNSSSVSEETRLSVTKAIEELDYKPPLLAKGLSQQRLKTIGLLLPDINNMYYPVVLRGIEDELAKDGYNLFVCNTDESILKEKNYIRNLLDKGVNGLMFLGTRPTTTSNGYIAELAKELPVIMINDYIIGSNVYSVMIDEVEGAYKAVSYLIELGHKEIAFVNGDVDYTTYRYKLRGYEKALKDNQIKIQEEFLVKEDPHEEGGFKGATRLLNLDRKPTAIFTASDQMAIGVIKAIYEAGYLIPEDFSLIGFSDIPVARQLYPELTTVNQFPHKTGVMASQVMKKLINGEELEQKRILLEPKLSIRKSCKKRG